MVRNEMYRLGIYEKALPSDLCFEKKLDEAFRLGFDQLEISIDESDMRLSRLDWSDSRKHELAASIAKTGVPIKTMCLSAQRKYPMGAADPAVRARSMEIIKKAIDFASEVGISIIQLAGYDVYYESGSDLTRALFAANLKKAVETASAAGVVLAFETMETPFMDTVHKAMDYVSAINSPWLGVYPDIGNLQNAAAVYGHSVVDDLAEGSGHIFAMHLKETKPGIYRNMRFGTGHTNYGDCLLAAKKIGVRMFTGEFWHQDGQDYEQEAACSAQFLRGRLDSVFI